MDAADELQRFVETAKDKSDRAQMDSLLNDFPALNPLIHLNNCLVNLAMGPSGQENHYNLSHIQAKAILVQSRAIAGGGSVNMPVCEDCLDNSSLYMLPFCSCAMIPSAGYSSCANCMWGGALCRTEAEMQ